MTARTLRPWWAAAAVLAGALYGCATPPPDPPVAHVGDTGPPATVETTTSTTAPTVRPAPGEDAWHHLPTDDAIYLEALHQSTTTTTAPPAPPTREEPRDDPPAPPPTTPTPPPAPAGPIDELICSYPWDCATALRVAACESGMNPGAVGGAGERGLFQIHPVHRAWLGARWDRLFDPAVNVAVAFEMWTTQGWGPWSCA